ncbi:MAG: hypothetical protein KBD78_01620 [Oligoflexales bacterium]|nr:hypothetical protein [Oligoflexales bacterium]
MIADLKSLKLYGILLLSGLFIVNCSSTEPTDEELETSGEEEAATENNNYSENQGTENSEVENEESTEDNGEFVNNASADDLMENMGINEGASQEFPMNNTASQNMMINNATANTVGMNGTPVAPVNQVNTVPQSSQGARVKYVTADGVTAHNQPNGTVVETLSLGDHPLVWDESNWVKTSEGYYISKQGLSDQPVGRTRRSTPWQ